MDGRLAPARHLTASLPTGAAQGEGLLRPRCAKTRICCVLRPPARLSSHIFNPNTDFRSAWNFGVSAENLAIQ